MTSSSFSSHPRMSERDCNGTLARPPWIPMWHVGTR